MNRARVRQVLSRHGPAGLATVALLLATLLAGIGLLGLSGGFLTGAALTFGVVAGFNLFLPSAGIRALTLARIACRYGEKVVGHEATLRIARDLRVWLFERMLALSPGQLSQLRTGDLLARLLGDIDAVDGLLVRAIGPLLALALAILALAGFALALDPLLGAWIALAATACTSFTTAPPTLPRWTPPHAGWASFRSRASGSRSASAAGACAWPMPARCTA